MPNLCLMKSYRNLIIVKNRINFSSFLILITAILLLFTSCEKNDNSACVDCYNNIIRCKINSVDWKPFCVGDLVFGCNPFQVQYYDDDKYFELHASNSKIPSGFVFSIKKVLVDTLSKFERYDFSTWKYTPNCKDFELDTNSNSAFRLLELNTSKRIFKAEFNAILLNECGDTTKITDGYLDLNY